MKKVLFLAAAGTAAALSAFSPTQQTNMLIQNGRLTPDFAGETAFRSSFLKQDKWTVRNYENHVKVTYDGRNGKPGLLFRNGMGKKGDTAWGLRSPMIRIPAGKSSFRCQITINTNQELSKSVGGKDYVSVLLWYDAAGKQLKTETALSLQSRGSISHTDVFRGKIPAKAASVQIQLGADNPNIEMDEYILFEQAELAFLGEKDPRKTGSVVSSALPCRDGDVFSYEADVPAGTSLKFFISTVDMKKKAGNVNFSGWKPVRQGETLHFPAGQENMIRWKAELVPSAKAYPSLKSVRIGEIVDTNWSDFNTSENPVVQRVSASPEADGRKPFVFRVTGPAPVQYSSMKVTLDNKDVTSLLKRNGVEYSLMPDKEFTPGIHEVAVSVQSVSGSPTHEELWFLIGTPKKVPRTTVRDDGMLLIDGKPFFPIGIYSVAKRAFNHFSYDEAFRGLKEGGFNTAHSYQGPNDPEFLSASEKYDIKLFIVPGKMEALNRKLGMKNIIAWYVADDTHMVISVEKLQTFVNKLRAVDPYRICTQADPVVGYRNYVKVTEGFLPEIYPVRQPTRQDKIECVPAVVRDMRTAMNNIAAANAAPRTVWSICQYMEGWSSWKRFPTAEELRAMSWASIVCGATGITWYTYAPGASKNHGAIYTPETWKTMTTVSREIASHQQTLVERTIPSSAAVIKGADRDAMNQNSIHVMAKKHDGKIWVFAVNSAYAPVTAKITVSGKSTVKDFKPYGVLIFTL